MKPKTELELAAMREGGKILAGIFSDLKKQVQPGVSERELNNWVEKEIRSRGAQPTYKDPAIGFPGVICISTNDEVVHSVPSGYVLRQGDVVSFDLVITYKKMKTDAAFTMVVGEDSPASDTHRLITATRESLDAGIRSIRPGVRTGDIAAAIEAVLTNAKLGIVRELVGHGIGHEMHEEPEVPNYGKKGTGVVLKAGMTIAIEPMAMLGDHRILLDKADGWTIKTADGSLAAHFEDTVLITDKGAEILTRA